MPPPNKCAMTDWSVRLSLQPSFAYIVESLCRGLNHKVQCIYKHIKSSSVGKSLNKASSILFATWFTIDKLVTELHNSACCVTRASCRINNTDTQLDILAKLSREKSSLSKCTYSFFTLSRDECLVSRDENLVSQDENRVSREGGNLLLSGTVLLLGMQ